MTPVFFGPTYLRRRRLCKEGRLLRHRRLGPSPLLRRHGAPTAPAAAAVCSCCCIRRRVLVPVNVQPRHGPCWRHWAARTPIPRRRRRANPLRSASSSRSSSRARCRPTRRRRRPLRCRQSYSPRCHLRGLAPAIEEAVQVVATGRKRPRRCGHRCRGGGGGGPADPAGWARRHRGRRAHGRRPVACR